MTSQKVVHPYFAADILVLSHWSGLACKHVLLSDICINAHLSYTMTFQAIENEILTTV